MVTIEGIIGSSIFGDQAIEYGEWIVDRLTDKRILFCGLNAFAMMLGTWRAVITTARKGLCWFLIGIIIAGVGWVAMVFQDELLSYSDTHLF